VGRNGVDSILSKLMCTVTLLLDAKFNIGRAYISDTTHEYVGEPSHITSMNFLELKLVAPTDKQSKMLDIRSALASLKVAVPCLRGCQNRTGPLFAAQ
jgi:hypothetical protein